MQQQLTQRGREKIGKKGENEAPAWKKTREASVVKQDVFILTSP